MTDSEIRPQLARIADDMAAGRIVPPVTTREFLSWFHAQRRGYWVVRSIREELEQAGLQTVPDFESAYIDAPIELRRVVASKHEEPSSIVAEQREEPASSESAPGPPAQITALVSKDPTYRISKLAAANQAVIAVTPNAPLAECITKMLLRDFSQLPVMTTDREVKGMISWKTIGSQLAFSKSAQRAWEKSWPRKFAQDASTNFH
jgi:CBS domain-containing protein